MIAPSTIDWPGRERDIRLVIAAAMRRDLLTGAAFALAFDAALRLHELTAVRRPDVDLTAARLDVLSSKTGQRRAVRLTHEGLASAALLLNAHAHDQLVTSGPDVLLTRWRRAAELAGVERLPFRAMRSAWPLRRTEDYESC
jgi:integrase